MTVCSTSWEKLVSLFFEITHCKVVYIVLEKVLNFANLSTNPLKLFFLTVEGTMAWVNVKLQIPSLPVLLRFMFGGCFEEPAILQGGKNSRHVKTPTAKVGGGGGESKYLGNVHRILLILQFISFGKEKVLSCRIYSGYTRMVACEPQMYYLSSPLSLRKANFCREATTRKIYAGHRLDIHVWENVLFVFFSAADQVTLLE